MVNVVDSRPPNRNINLNLMSLTSSSATHDPEDPYIDFKVCITNTI